MSTQNLITTRSGTGFTIDVSICNLLPDLNLKDFIAIHEGVIVPNSYYQKTTQTVLTYVGPSLDNVTIQIRRKTPNERVQTVTYGSKLSSSLFNDELDRNIRWREEVDLNYTGVPADSVLPSNVPFGPTWDGDTVYPPTKDAVYDIINTLAPKASPAFTGTPTAPTPTSSDSSNNIATTAYVQQNLVNYATLNSPVFTGIVTVPNQTANSNNNRAANTAYVDGGLSLKADTTYVDAALALKANLASPALTGNPTAPTPALYDNDTSIATTAFVQQLCRPAFIATSNANQTQSTDNTLIVCNLEQLDTNNVFSGNSFNVPVTGTYLFGGSVQLINNNASPITLGVRGYVNTTPFRELSTELNIPAGASPIVVIPPTLVTLAQGQTLQMGVTTYGASFSYTIASVGTYIWGFRIPI